MEANQSGQPECDGEQADVVYLVREPAFAMQPRHGLAIAEGHGDAGRELGPLLEQQAGRLVKPCRIDVRVLHEIEDAVASFGRPTGGDGRFVERCFAFDVVCVDERAPVEEPAHQRGIVFRGRAVQRRDTTHITRTDERRVGFHQGDGVRGAALGNGLP
jgi:hypothetical protein